MNHKYGFHCNRTGDDILDAVRRIRPTVIKVLDPNVDFLRAIRDITPEALIIARLVISPSEQDRFAADPIGQGRAFADRVLRMEANHLTAQGRRLLDAWESYNEIFSESASPDLKRRYDDFQVAFGQKIKAEGLEPVAMNFGNGNMLGHDFLTYFPGTLETHTYLGFHEYDWPTLWRLHQQNIVEKNEGGMWMALRYRRIMGDVRRVYGDRHIALITECGLTQVANGGPDVGWRSDPSVTEDSYWQSLMWYNQELRRDAYVKAALLFVVGAIAPWHTFETLGGIIDRLEVYQRTAPPEPTPTPPPTPAPEPAAHALRELLLAEAERRQVIQFNPNASLQQRIFADGFVPNSPEFEAVFDHMRYVAQRAEHLASGEVRVYYVPVGRWDEVAFQPRLV